MASAKPLFAVPADLQPPAAKVAASFEAGRVVDAIKEAQQALSRLKKSLSPKLKKPDRAPDSSAFQYYAVTLILTDALAALERWKEAKEVLGRYRTRFPQDAWGFRAGARVTRLDPQVNDSAAVQRAVELLEGEADRLEKK